MALPRPTPSSGDAVRLGHWRQRDWDGVTAGVHVPAGTDLWQRLRAWATVLPPGSAFTGLTAAAVRRWWLPPLPADVPVFATQPRDRPRPRRVGLQVSRPAAMGPTEHWFGLDLTCTVDTLLDCARVVSLLDLVVLTDAASAAAACSPGTLLDASRVARYDGRPGIRLLRRAVDLSDPRSESPWETLLRVMHQVSGVVVEPQVELQLSDGARVRADLWLVGTRTLHEYDGEHHRTREGHRADLRRDRRLLTDGWARRGYTSTDLLRRPEQILREADAAIERAHDPARLEPWLAMLDDSLFTARGTAAFRARIGLPPDPRS